MQDPALSQSLMNKHCHIEYGQYVQTHEKHDNSMVTSAVGALALRPTGNQQGGYYFYSLSSGRRLHRTHWTVLPMPDEVKDRVHALARRARVSRGLTFTDSDGTDLDEIYPDNDGHDDNDDDNDNDDDDADGSTYNGTDGEDNLSHNSDDDSDNDSDDDDDSDYTPPNDDGDASTDSSNFSVSSTPDQPLSAPIYVKLGGVNNTGDRNDNPRNTGVETKITEVNENNEIENTYLEAYVNELENELDNEIVELDSDYNQQDSDGSGDETDGAFEPMDEAEADKIRADATREQASDDAEMPKLHHRHDDNSDSDSDDEPDNKQPLDRLRRRRTPNYGHLKGRDGDGSLPTVARPHEFGGRKHQSHVILQSIIMT
jgi:hypothetical protein